MRTIARTLTGSSWREIETPGEAASVTAAAELGGMAQCFDMDRAKGTGARYYTLVDLAGNPSATLRIGGGRLPPGPGGAEMTTREGHMAYGKACSDPFVLHGAAIEKLARTLGIEIPTSAHVPIPGMETRRRLGGLLPGRLVPVPGANPIETRERATDVDAEVAGHAPRAAAGIAGVPGTVRISLTRDELGEALSSGTVAGSAATRLLLMAPEAARHEVHARDGAGRFVPTGEVLRGREALTGLRDGFGTGASRTLGIDVAALAGAVGRNPPGAVERALADAVVARSVDAHAAVPPERRRPLNNTGIER